MATRAEIEAEMAQRLGTAPKKRTRAEIEAEMAQKLGSFKAPQAMSEYEKSAEYRNVRDRAFRDLEKDQSFLENAAIGAGGAVAGMGRGLQQLGARAIGADEKLAELQAEEADIRSRMKPVSESGGGITGNILANAAMFLAPGSAVTKAGQAAGRTAVLAPKAAQLLTAMLGEGALGAVGGALQPTVEGESLAENVKSSAALNALFPALGAGIKSTPVQKAADTVLDYTPIFAGRRREARNLVTKAAHDAEIAAYNASKAEAAQATKVAKALRDQELMAPAKEAEAVAQSTIAKAAGWDVFPTNKMDAEAALEKVGAQYGEALKPVRMPMPELDDAMLEKGSPVGSYVKTLQKGVEKEGAVSGELYKSTRAELVKARKAATQSEERRQLGELIDRLDQQLETSVPPELKGDILRLRKQYMTGATVVDADWAPGIGPDVKALRKRFDKRKADASIRDPLYTAESMVREAKEATKAPFEAISPAMAKPENLVLEKADPFRMFSVLGAAGALGTAGLGAAPAGAILASLPVAASVVKQATNPRVAKTVNALRRGATIGYGTVLAPNASTKESE